jgi:flagellar L-ring protein precursor FlgH
MKLLFLILPFLFVGCFSNQPTHEKIKDLQDDKSIMDSLEEELLLNNQTLPEKFNNNSIPLKKVNIFKPKQQSFDVGQLVTITIDENISSSSSGKKKLAKTGTSSRSGGVITNSTNTGVVQDFFNNHINPLTSLGFETSKDISFDGTGTTSREEKFNTKITAFITKKMVNNIYKIEGVKEIVLNGQYQLIKISGFVRKRQLKNYTINSSDIANLKVSFETKGDVSENTEQNYIGRILDSSIF